MMNLPSKIDKGCSSSMDQEFLPPEIIINILSRLPAKTVIRCKCVCKSWLELLETPEFAKDHLSKSVPDLIVYHDVFKIFEFVDEVELEHHSLHYNLVIEFEKTIFTSPRNDMGIVGSVNGLVLLHVYCPNAIYVCNPTTREYIELPCLDTYQNSNSVTYGFGVKVTSGQYKVVRILQNFEFDENNEVGRVTISECWVYTLGTRSWRSIVPCPFHYWRGCLSTHAFFNGNLHWLVEDLNVDDLYLITCFDLETEVFSSFSPPPPLGRWSFRSDPIGFEDCLCICDNTIKSDNKIVIWMMKEYGNENSWTKQFVFTIHSDLASQYLQCICPLKLFEDGDILLLWGPMFLFYYSNKINTAQKLDLFEIRRYGLIMARLHVSSFLSLRSFAMETVKKF